MPREAAYKSPGQIAFPLCDAQYTAAGGIPMGHLAPFDGHPERREADAVSKMHINLRTILTAPEESEQRFRYRNE